MSEKLTIKLTRLERIERGGVIAYKFSVSNDGVAVRECWSAHDEVY